MKICLLTYFHASWTKQEASILKELGHSVYLLYPNRNRILKYLPRIPIVEVLCNYLYLCLRCIPATLWADLVLCWFVFPAGLFAALFGKLFHRPVILNAAGYDVAHLPSINYGTSKRWYLKPLVSWALKNATEVIAISKESALSAEKLGAKRVKVIYEGIDVGKFKPVMKRRTRKRNQYILLTVLVLGKAGVKRKDVKSLLESLPEVVGVFPNLRLVVVGKKGAAYPALRETVKRLGVENNVVFKGFVPDSELVKLYNECDVFVFPSLYESFPTACAEAQACAKPVVTTNVASMPEVVKNSESGILVKPGDPKALAHTIIDLLSDSGLRRRLGESGRKRMVRFFSKEIRKEKLQAILNTLADYGG